MNWRVFLLFALLMSRVGADLHATTSPAEPDQNPTGNTGALKGQITTAGSYDAHSGNATRSITDLYVPNAPGLYGLDFTRHYNSVRSDSQHNSRAQTGPVADQTTDFGSPGWSHSWSWKATYQEEFEVVGGADGGQENYITSITITFPDGHATKYSVFRSNRRPIGQAWPADPRWGPPYLASHEEANFVTRGAGIHDRLNAMAEDGSSFWLYLTDGGSILFQNSPQGYQAKKIFDSNGFLTTLTYGIDAKLRDIAQEGGRHLLLTWGTVCEPGTNPNHCWSKVITKAQYVPSTGQAAVQTVDYGYSWIAHGSGSPWLFLTAATYHDEPAIGQTSSAVYTYEDYIPSAGYIFGGPRLVVADDPHFEGPMRSIRYRYQLEACDPWHPPIPENPPGSHFYYYHMGPTSVAAEMSGTQRNAAGPIVVSQFHIGCYDGRRTETNGLGGSRMFFFGGAAGPQGSFTILGYELGKVTDFTTGDPLAPSVPTQRQNYYAGEPREVWDGRGIRTELFEGDDSGQPSEIRHVGSDGSVYRYDRTNPGNSAARDTARIPNPNNKWLFSQTDERNQTTVYTRDSRRRVVGIDHPGASSEAYSYNSLNEATSHTLPSGAVVTNIYDGRGLLQQEQNSVDGALGAKIYTYDANDRVATMSDYRSRASGAPYAVRLEYNGRNQVTKVHYAPTGGSPDPVTSYEYNRYGDCIAMTDEKGYRSVYQYDDYGRCVRYTEPVSAGVTRTWRWTYDRDIPGVGLRSAYAHTSSEWRLQIEPIFNAANQHRVTARQHDVENRITVETTGLIVTGPDATTPADLTTLLGTLATPADAQVRRFTYDGNGQKLTATDPLGRVTEFTYDNRNRLWKTTEHPTDSTPPRVTETLYDTTGNKTLVRFPDLRTQQWPAYNPFGEPTRFIDERGNATDLLYQWGPMKKLQKVTTYRTKDGGGIEEQPTTFSYDGMGRATNTLFPDGSNEHTRYDPAGQLLSWKTRRNQTKTVTLYDARGREKAHSWNDGTPGVTRSWDDANHLLTLSNNYAQIGYIYDYAGQVLSESDAIAGSNGVAGPGSGAVAKSVVYSRYPDGEINTVTYPSGTVVTRTYTARHQTKKVSWSGGSVTYNYLRDGKVDYSDYGNGLRNDFGYDGRGYVSLVDVSRLSPSQRYTRRTYWRDTRDRITAWKKAEDGRGDRYGYDAEGQLTSASYEALTPESTPSGAARSDRFIYDELGSRQGSNYVANRGWMAMLRRNNKLNQYLSWENSYAVGDPHHWGSALPYDDNFGSPWVPPANGVLMGDGYLTASYNALNQPLAVYSPALVNPGPYLYFGYDPLGRCVKRWRAGTNAGVGSNPATYYYYDGWDLIQEGGSASAPSRVYVHGARVDEVVASGLLPGNQWAYSHYDARGHCILLSLASGAIQEKYGYDAFGLPYFYTASGTAQPKVNGRPVSAWGNRFLFTGREWLGEVGLYDFRNRLYQPELGRFMQPDPKEFAAGDYNLYRYCHNDPVNKTDAFGLFDVGFEGFGTPTLTGGTSNTVGNVALRNFIQSQGGQTFSRTQAGQTQAIAAIKQALAQNPKEPINVTGYSRGAEAANDVAGKLGKEGIPVNRERLIDPVSRIGTPQHLTAPDNVKQADNYYQRNGGPFSGGALANPGANRQNHDLTDEGVNHNTIVDKVLKKRDQ